jgi:hypothetical protein
MRSLSGWSLYKSAHKQENNVGYPKRVGGVHFIEVSGCPEPVLPALLLRRLEDKFENMGAQMVREVADNRSPVYLNKDLPGLWPGRFHNKAIV